MKYNVLIVDDEPMILRALNRVLRDSTIAIHTCTNFGDAIKILESTDIDLVITDVMLAGHDPDHPLNGISLMKTVKSMMDIPVFVMSGYPNALISAKHSGADERISKPYDSDELNILVNYYLKQKKVDPS